MLANQVREVAHLVVTGCGLTLVIAAAAQAQTVPQCPVSPSQPSGLCEIDTQLTFSGADLVSGDGQTFVFSGNDSNFINRAFLWSPAGGPVDLGSLFPPNGGIYAAALSQDGSVVVGSGIIDSNWTSRAFRWTAQSGLVSLGTLRSNQTGGSEAKNVSANGAYVVGWASADNADSGRAFVWSATDGMRNLGTLNSDNTGWSTADFVSDSGAVVSGQSSYGSFGITRVFRWTEADGMVDIGPMTSGDMGYAYISGMSADGNVIVGSGNNDADNSRAFRWVVGMLKPQDLGTLRSDQSGYSYAKAVSEDGTTVVGEALDDQDRARAFRWVSGAMQDLGTLNADGSGTSGATHVSSDGTVVAGSSSFGQGYRAFRWDAMSGMIDLGSLSTSGDGYTEVRSMSDDGSVIVGASLDDSNDLRPFIWRTEMQDIANLLASFPLVASVNQEALSAVEVGTERVMDIACSADEGQGCMTVGGALDNGGVSNTQETSSIVSYGRGLANGLKLGGTLALGSASEDSDALIFDRATRVGIWSSWSATGAREGLVAETALGWGKMDATIERGVGLDNVMVATGQAGLSTASARAAVAYGIRAGGDWLITPRASVARFETTRDAYTETGSDFNATYDELTVSRTTATLDLSGEHKLGEAAMLSLGVGVAHDLSTDETILTGSSTIPGLESVAAGSGLKRRETRGIISAGYRYDLGANRSLGGSLRVEQSAFGDKANTSVALGYSVKF